MTSPCLEKRKINRLNEQPGQTGLGGGGSGEREEKDVRVQGAREDWITRMWGRRGVEKI